MDRRKFVKILGLFGLAGGAAKASLPPPPRIRPRWATDYLVTGADTGPEAMAAKGLPTAERVFVPKGGTGPWHRCSVVDADVTVRRVSRTAVRLPNVDRGWKVTDVYEPAEGVSCR